MSRPTQDDYMMALARAAASRTTCLRRGVGCVLTDAKGRVLAIGYNGVASGQPHCNEATSMVSNPALAYDMDGRLLDRPRVAEHWELRELPFYGHACARHDLPSGQDGCEAVHAEQNAVLQCARPDDVATVYVTTSPCRACAKLLMNTGATRVVFGEEFDQAVGDLFVRSRAGRLWEAYREGAEASAG